MKHPSSQTRAGLTWPEVLVCVLLGYVVLCLVDANLVSRHTLTRAQATQALSNMKQLHLATQQMALDGTTTGETNLGWPGDTGGTFTNWAAQLVPSYLSTNDLAKLLSVAGRRTPPGGLPGGNTNGILVYAVSTNSAPGAIGFATANLLATPAGFALNTNQPLFAQKSVVVFHKGGDGAVLLPRQLTNVQVVGAYTPLCR